MSVLNQGSDLNRTVTNFLVNADFGAFGNAIQSVVLKGDPSRQQYITGFSFYWSVGLAADANASHTSDVFLVENRIISPESTTVIFPEINPSLRFAFGQTMPQFRNTLDRQLEAPFKLLPGVNYSVIGAIGIAAALAAVMTSRLTVFGFEDQETAHNTFYGSPRR